MVYAEFGGQTECIMGNWKIENLKVKTSSLSVHFKTKIAIYHHASGCKLAPACIY